MFQKTTLENGLRILTFSMPKSFSTGIWAFAKVGSRYEDSENAGISHFLEHMILKATRKWPTQKELSFTIENNGAIFNGLTNIEDTRYFIKIPNEKVNNGVELILDMVLHPKLTENDFEKEKEVINQEINRLYDNPDDYIWDLIGKTMWPAHPLGQPIVGSKETIRNLQLKNLRDFFSKFYTPKNMIISAAGNIEHQNFVKIVGGFFDKKFRKKEENLNYQVLEEKQIEPQLNLEFKKTEQSHLIIAVKTFNRNHKDKFVLNLINSILGVGWSARLMLNIRTQKGLSYTIHSSVSYFNDTGCLLINAGVKNEKLKLAIKEIIQELKHLKDEKVKEKELHQAKEKLKGRFLFGIELPEERAEWYGYQELFQSKILNPEEVLDKIDEVTSEDILRVARELFVAKRVNLALVGPFREKDKEELREILKKID